MDSTKMIALLGTLLLVRCITLYFYFSLDTVIPVKPVLLGESVMFNCDLSNIEVGQKLVYWYKQSPGETLRPIVKFTLKHQKPATSVLSPEFSDSRWVAGVNETFSSLKILRATQEDEGTYHCAVMDWTGTNKWKGTYLIARVFHQPTVLEPGLSADHGNLQCSVFTDLDNKMCSEDLSVFWLRAEAEESHPDIIYIDNNKRGECKKKSDSQNSCFYHFSKNITSPDSAFYYCAIATCGKILFGNATKSKICKRFSSTYRIIYLSCNKRGSKCSNLLSSTQAEGGNENYAALHFSTRKKQCEGRKKKMETEECFYSEIKI
uniref:Ig-like domain-containing protein n=1 Tax=Poecilia reticulata TaxID=8081 RepID=A0A3P9PI05_POERE